MGLVGLVMGACGPKPEPPPVAASSPAPVLGDTAALDAQTLEHCVQADRVQLEGSRSRLNIRCRTLVAVVVEGAGAGLSEELAVGLLVQEAFAWPGMRLEHAPETLMLSGEARALQRWSLGGEAGLAGIGLIDGKGTSSERLVVVAAPASDEGHLLSSLTLLEALLRADELELPRESASLQFLGSALELPESCTSQPAPAGSGRVRCATGWTRWDPSPSLRDPRQAAELEAVVLRDLEERSGGSLHTSRPSCAIDEVSARCLVVELPGGEGALLHASTDWHGVGVALQCLMVEPGRLPPVCAELVTLGGG